MKYPSVFIGENTAKVDKWNPLKDGIDVSFDYIDLSSVCKKSKRINDELVSSIRGQDAPSRARQLISVGDVLVSTVRPNLNGVALVKKGYKKGTASTGYSILRSTKELDSKYLFYWVTTQTFISNMVRKSTGANYPAVSDRIIKESKIPLPPLPVQQKIAAILDTADGLKQKDKALIAKYDELSQSLFLDMFGDPVSNSKGWEINTLGEICHKITDGTHQSPKFLSEGIPFLLVANIIDNAICYETKKYISTGEYLQLTKSTPIEVGDLLYTSVGSYGKPAIVKHDNKFCFQRHLAHLKPNHALVNVVFLHQMMISPLIKRQADRLARGVAQKTLNLREIKSMKAFLPPITLQNQFAERIQAIEQQKHQAQASLRKSEDLFNCLLQKAFKGELV